MYGGKRIIFQKSSHIIRAGGGTWHPIGRYYETASGDFEAELLKPEHAYSARLEDATTMRIQAKSKGALRKMIIEMPTPIGWA